MSNKWKFSTAMDIFLLSVVFGRKFLLKEENALSMYTLHSVMSASFKFFSEKVYSATSRQML
jgi:hypothetical protein